MPAVNASHSSAVNTSFGPSGSLECRTATAGLPVWLRLAIVAISSAAGLSLSAWPGHAVPTSTQLPPEPLLKVLLRHAARDRSDPRIPRPPSWSRSPHVLGHGPDQACRAIRRQRHGAQVIEHQRIPLDISRCLQILAAREALNVDDRCVSGL